MLCRSIELEVEGIQRRTAKLLSRLKEKPYSDRLRLLRSVFLPWNTEEEVIVVMLTNYTTVHHGITQVNSPTFHNFVS